MKIIGHQYLHLHILLLSLIMTSCLLGMTREHDDKKLAEPSYIVFHGLGGNSEITKLFVDHGIIHNENRCISVDGPEVMRNAHGDFIGIDNKKVALGQDGDTEKAKRGFKQVERTFGKDPDIVIGYSKGSAVAINSVALLNKKPKIVLLVATPANFNQVAAFTVLGADRLGGSAVESVGSVVQSSVYPGYQADGYQPIDLISGLPQDTIVCFLHAVDDDFVHISNSYQLAKELLEAGHNNVYVVEAKWGGHIHVLENRQDMKNIMHALKAQAGLQHNQKQAAKIRLGAFRPTIDELDRKLEKIAQQRSFPRQITQMMRRLVTYVGNTLYTATQSLQASLRS